MSRFVTQANLSQFSPGTVLRVNRGLYDHVFLLGENTFGGVRMVLSFGSGSTGYEEIPFSLFASGVQVVSEGYFGNLAPTTVLQRAREAARRKYSWFWFNCEHFVRHAHGVPEESPQLQRVIVLAGVGITMAGLPKVG